MMSNAQKIERLLDGPYVKPDQIVGIRSSRDDTELRTKSSRPNSRGLFHFLAELRRRRVCRAATMYAVVFWLVCQIVDTIAPELGLPEWTVRFVVVLGLIGLPFALIISWLVDITADGVVVDHGKESTIPTDAEPKSRNRIDCIIDCALLIAAVAIGIHLSTGLLSADTNTVQPISPKINVLPFRIASGNDADAFAEGLVAEIQYELASNAGATVIASTDPILTSDCLGLTGAVAIGDKEVRVTASIIDNATGAITWSQVFTRPRSISRPTPVDFAREIAAALPLPLEPGDSKDAKNVR